ncbi:Ku protein [Salinicola socius]|uniref:Ku domain-containing protein n=1 Tax=Salinicola socius TaxID=404433 RepID=A0A1Q8SUD7_9GAMM|nr:Ku protein [Salinicola socius]OLO05070.1 hypothetical protein BTW07_05495 [Salinicola socius]
MPKSNRTRPKAPRPEKNRHPDRGFHGPRPFWSGTIAFGLVNLPVGLYAAYHSRDVTLKEVDDQGRPLSRRFFSETGRQPLKSNELARGIEVSEDHYAIVEDQEIEDATLEHRREIELSRFVSLDELDPLYFRRAYFLVPDSRSAGRGGALKPYRLLAAAMASAGRAGIATLVMRGREVLVAILAEDGILRAEALRFHDELRSPRSIGLAAPGEPDAKRERQIHRAMDRLNAKQFDPDELIDPHIEALKKRVRQKRRRHQDIAPIEPVRSGTEDDSSENEEGAEVIDLMQVLKRSLKRGRIEPTGKKADEGKDGKAAATPAGAQTSGLGTTAKSKTTARSRKGTKSSKADPSDLSRLSREMLYEMAQQRRIRGRSDMNKMQLIEALRRGD